MGLEMKARIWAKRTEQTLEGGAGGPVEWRQQRQVRFGDSECQFGCLQPSHGLNRVSGGLLRNLIAISNFFL